MPYIKKDLRAKLDKSILDLIDALNTVDGQPDGMLNYIFTRLLAHTVIMPKSYANLERAIGVLECCKLELYRRAAAPYEDKKAVENGELSF
ncbi:MAG: hypothetical protein ACE14Q_07650 [Acidobacteriota bacterium]